MKFILIFISGSSLWPVLEYLIHRFMGHEVPGNNPFYKEHTTHHAEAFYFAPASSKFLAAIIVCSSLTLLGTLITKNFLMSFIFVLGFVLMYLFYERVHYIIHAYPPKTSWGLKIRKHHLAHHFHAPKKNYGVTIHLFDRLFKTHLPVKTVRVPKNFAPEWLKKDPTRFKDDLELR